MDIEFELQGIRFVANRDKARRNPAKHPERKGICMKTADLKKRLKRERPMATVTLRMPEDVVEDLKRIAPMLGFSGYQPLMRAYIGQGLRADLEKLESAPIARLIENLKAQGIPEEALAKAVAGIAS